MNNRIWILGTALLSIAVIALGLLLGVLPKLQETTAANLSLLDSQAQIASYEAELASLKKQYEDIDDVRDKLEELREGMPADGAYADFIREIQQIALETGATITGYSQTAPLVFGPATADGGTAEAPISGGTLVAIPIEVKYSAPDFNGLAFMDSLRLGDRILYINGFNFEFNADPIGNIFGDFTLNLLVYTLVDPSASPLPASAPTDPATADPTPAPTETGTPVPTDSGTPTVAP